MISKTTVIVTDAEMMNVPVANQESYIINKLEKFDIPMKILGDKKSVDLSKGTLESYPDYERSITKFIFTVKETV